MAPEEDFLADAADFPDWQPNPSFIPDEVTE
jgi:hypothetical protein